MYSTALFVVILATREVLASLAGVVEGDGSAGTSTIRVDKEVGVRLGVRVVDDVRPTVASANVQEFPAVCKLNFPLASFNYLASVFM
jgi:hypothetical protein